MISMAGRKRHSAEDIVRKLRRADELTAAGKTGEEIAAELGVSAATLYNWRRTYGGWTPTRLRSSKTARAERPIERLLAEAELEKDALREVARENSEPGCQALRRGHAQEDTEYVGAVGVQGRWAGPFHLSKPADGADPGRSRRRIEGLAACLRHQPPVPWFRRAWAALRYDERREVNKKKIHRLWREKACR